MSVTLAKITPAQHISAVEWITEAFDLANGDLSALTAQQIYRTIQQRYDGGWNQFVADHS